MFSNPTMFFSSQGAADAYYNGVVALSPTAYWRFGEPSGTTANDENSTYNGTYTGTFTLNQTSLITGDADTCVDLDGSTGYVNLGDVLDIGTNDFSIVIWFNVDSLNTARVFSKRGGGSFGAVEGFQFQYTTSTGWNQCVVDAGDGSYTRLNTSSFYGVTTGTTHMAVLTWSNSNQRLRLYIDGSLKETGTTTGTMSGKSIDNATTAVWGQSSLGSLFVNGRLDEGAFWLGTELTGTNVSDLYALGTA